MPFLPPNQQRRSTEGITKQATTNSFRLIKCTYSLTRTHFSMTHGFDLLFPVKNYEYYTSSLWVVAEGFRQVRVFKWKSYKCETDILQTLKLIWHSNKNLLIACVQCHKKAHQLELQFSINFMLETHTQKAAATSWLNVHTHPLSGVLSRTIPVGRYQKKHSPTHSHPDHQTSFINFLPLLWVAQ